MHKAQTPEKAAPWWQSAAAYQIYPRSFNDSNGDGIGDIPGIIEKLDHLKDLGIGFIWLSPVYKSPMVDNGYDISDYRDIAPEFGTLEDFDNLLAEARARDIRIVMDLVVNHCSNQHPWFTAACASVDNPEHEFFIWRNPGPNGEAPNDHQACFGGSAWTYVPAVGKYYLGMFSPEQPDLNWQNPALRREIYDMMNWWFDKGIGGFRMDVINLIGKDVDAGNYEDGPHLHPFLQEMHRETLAGRDVVTVGESWAATLDNALLYCGEDRKELNMVFQFAHVTQGWDEKLGKFKPKPFSLPRFKKVFNDWQALMENDGWNSLFLSNHDLPRQVSVYGNDGEFRVQSAKLLATVMHLMKGTPYIYQGEEIGMTNVRFTRLDQYRDLETLRHHEHQIAAGVSEEDFIKGANANGRDNARTPVQWTAGEQTGFTSGTPWIEVNPNHTEINVEADRADAEGVFEHYRQLVKLRKELPVVSHGSFTPYLQDHEQIFAYARMLEGQKVTVVANFSDQPCEFEVPTEMATSGECISSNYGQPTDIAGKMTLAPFEAFALLSTKL